MILSSLASRNFRNLESGAVDFHPSSNIFVGRNGQGKTNLVEAIYFLATTRSFRTTRVASLAQFDAADVFVSGNVLRDGIEKTLSVGLETGEGRRRILMINGERVTLPSYLGALDVFAYSAARLEILRGSPDERRRFLDRGIASVNAGYLQKLTRYTRVLKQRNALLHAIAAHEAAEKTLDAWDDEYSAAASEVIEARTKYTTHLAEAFRAIVEEHRYHIDELEITYKPSEPDPRKLRRQEIRARVSLAGPQRDTVDFALEGRAASEVLSGGEQKMIVLFLKFAKLELFRRRHDDGALFLLDDVDAELDLEILQQLLSKLPSSTQLFATSAKERFLAVLETGSHRRLTVEKGRVIGAVDFT